MSARGLLRFVAARFALNLKAAFEYRVSFWSQVLFMMANNVFMLWFWRLFFGHFGSVRGWNAEDVYLLWGITPTAFGIANTLAGNAMELAGVVADGELDYFLSLPPPTLLHALVTKTRVSAIGDLAFGLVVLALVTHGDPARFALALAVCVPAAVVFTAVAVLGASLAFFVGESRGITFQVVNLLITFSTYPESIFHGQSRWMLYLVLPAAFFSFLPARAVHAGFQDPLELAAALGWLLLGSGAFLAASLAVFHRGLRRYSSGSSLAVRL
jgi:ABC-2 type transport system permease protein